MEEGKAIHDALSGSHHKPKLRTESVHYKRADNGGFHAEVHKHHAEPPHAFHHTEHHIVPHIEGAQEHLGEQMGDQPAAGEMPEEAEEGAPPAAAGAAAAPEPTAGM